MYKSGGLLKALLKDPAQRKMAEKMLGKAAKGMAVKSYPMGGKMYENGGKNDKESTDARDEFAAFQMKMRDKYGPDDFVDIYDQTEYITLAREAEREQEYYNNKRASKIEEEIDARNVPNEPTSDTKFGGGVGRQRVKDNRMINERAARDQYFMEKFQGRSYPPGYLMPKTEMERTQRLESIKREPRMREFMESLPMDVSSYGSDGRYAGGGMMEYGKGGMMEGKLKQMYASGGMLKALLKDPAQRKMAEDMLKNMAMGGKMDYGMGGKMDYRMGGKMDYAMGGKMDYAMGGKMKYRSGGSMTEMDLDRIQRGGKEADELRFEYVGDDYLQQRPEDIKSSGKLLEFFTVSEAARALNDMNIDVRGMGPEKILKAARVKGINPMSSARELFDREMFKRKGGISDEFESIQGKEFESMEGGFRA